MGELEERKARYDKLRSDWGRELLDEFPSDISKPNFATDEFACRLWAMRGWGQYLLQAATLGVMHPTVSLQTKDGWKDFGSDFDMLSLDDKRMIAERTFDDASYLWAMAKQEADSVAAAQQRKIALIEGYESEVRAL